MSVSGPDFRHHIIFKFISVQDLKFLVLVVHCLMSYIAPQAAGKPPKGPF